MDFYRCFFEPGGVGGEGEDVWEWRNSNFVISCAGSGWTIPDIWLQCRVPRALGALPYWKINPRTDAALCVTGGTTNIAWADVEASCGPPFSARAWGQIAPGIGIDCIACYLTVRIEVCPTGCGCTPSPPSRLFGAITRVVTPGDYDCSCFVGLTWQMDFSTTPPADVQTYLGGSTMGTGWYSHVLDICGGGLTEFAGITRDMFAFLNCRGDPATGTISDYSLHLRGGVFPRSGCIGVGGPPAVSFGSRCNPFRIVDRFQAPGLCCTGFSTFPLTPPVLEVEILP